MHSERMTYKIRRDRGTAAPSLDHTFFVFSFVHRQHLFFEVSCYIRTFFNRTSHVTILSFLLVVLFLSPDYLLSQFVSVFTLDDQLIAAFSFRTGFQTS